MYWAIDPQHSFHQDLCSQLAFTYSKPTIEALEEGVKYIQS